VDVPTNDPDFDFSFSRTFATSVHRSVIEELRREAGDPGRFDRLRRFLLTLKPGITPWPQQSCGFLRTS